MWVTKRNSAFGPKLRAAHATTPTITSTITATT